MNTDRCPPPDWSDETELDSDARHTITSAPSVPRTTRRAPSNGEDDRIVARLLGALKSSPVRFTLLCDRMSLARGQGDLSDDEREEIYALARTLSIDATQVSALEEWVKHVQSQSASSNDDGSPAYLEVLAERLEEASIPIGAVAAASLGGMMPRPLR